MASLPREVSKLPEHGWGKYAEAVARWEDITLREPPHPRVASPRGNLRLSPRFVEWMMGLPEGWVTAAVSLYRYQAFILGNGVVPQQGAAALRELLARAQSSAIKHRDVLHDCALNKVPRPAGHYYGDVEHRG